MPPRKKKVAAGSVGLDAIEVAAKKPPASVSALADRVASNGGSALAIYREPFGSHWVILASLPVDKVTPTPFQRLLSDAHTKKLEAVIPKVGRYLDPLIAVEHGDSYWTPNGMHRLEAMKRLGAKSIVVLLVPEQELAYRILAPTTEKAHNLKDKSIEVTRMAAALANDPLTGQQPESDWAFEFEEPAYLTIGRCYEANGRFSGGAYMPVVRRCEAFFDEPLNEVGETRAERCERLLELDKEVARCVAELKDAGFQSSYLKPFVVARLNPLRFSRSKTGTVKDFDETIDKMMVKAAKFDAGKVKAADLAASAGGSSD